MTSKKILRAVIILLCLGFGVFVASLVTSWPESAERTVRIDDTQVDGVRKPGGTIVFKFPARLEPVTGGPTGPGESVAKTVTYSLTEGPSSSNLKSSHLQAETQTLTVSCQGMLKENCYVVGWERPATIRFVFERTTE